MLQLRLICPIATAGYAVNLWWPCFLVDDLHSFCVLWVVVSIFNTSSTNSFRGFPAKHSKSTRSAVFGSRGKIRTVDHETVTPDSAGLKSHPPRFGYDPSGEFCGSSLIEPPVPGVPGYPGTPDGQVMSSSHL